MPFPTKGAVVGVGGGVFFYIFGFPVPFAAALGLVGFLVMGGLDFARVASKTLSRDLRTGKNLIILSRTIEQHRQDKKTIPYSFVEVAKKYSNKTAILFEDQKWTFKELDEYANRVANHFRSAGLQRGDTVALFVENCPEFTGLWLGLGKLGVVSAFINYNLRQDALAHCIRISKACAVVFSAPLGDALCSVLPDLDPALSDMCYSVCGESTLSLAKNLDTKLKSFSPIAPPKSPDISFDDLVCYIYTSGTTGMPKACAIKNERYMWFAFGQGLMMGIGPEDVVYCTLPLYHTNGGVLATGQMILRGATLALRKKFSASNFWNDCVKFNCTVVYYIGEVCRYLLAQPKRPSDTQHRVRLAMGNGLRPQIWPAFQKRFRVPHIGEFYGSTEGNVGMINIPGKEGACGFISVLFPFLNPTCLIKVDPETGKHVRDGNGFCIQAGVNEPGEAVGTIQRRTGRKFDGYENEKATKKKVLENVFKLGDAYFLSGDILRMDEEGFMYFCDRTGDTFRWKGENVSTTEVESIISNILELQDVIVYGVEIPGMEGRAGMAAIAGSEEKVDLKSLSHQLPLSLPGYAVPIFIRLIEEAKLTGTFKLQKVQLRNEAFNIEEVADPLYLLDPAQKVYVPFTPDLYQQLMNGAIRV